MSEIIKAKDSELGNITIQVDEQGVAQKFKTVLRLQEGVHVVDIQGKGFITVVGMDYINRVAGVTILTPAQVVVDGKPMPNPYIERDESGMVKSVIVRKMAIGRAPTGQLVATDYVLSYNRHALLLQMLAKKSAKFPSAVFLGSREEDPREQEIAIETVVWSRDRNGKAHKSTQEEKIGGGGRWQFYELDRNLGYWVNLSHPEVQAMMADYINIIATLERRAQSIAARNAMAHHPAIGGAYATRTSDGKWVKVVYGLRYEQDPAGLKKALEDVESGKASVEEVQPAEVIQIEGPVEQESVVEELAHAHEGEVVDELVQEIERRQEEKREEREDKAGKNKDDIPF